MNRIVRGGSWGFDPQNVRVVYRYRIPPGNRINNLGLRLARGPQ
jgi:formylglycine-generating enzyme required for sulfatase activity